jgi:hypothetical protein
MSGAASEIIVNMENESQQPDKKEIVLEDDIPKLDGSYTLYRFSGCINYININVLYIYFRIILHKSNN